MTPVLLTERLLLRPIEHEDAHAIAAILGDPRVASGLCDVPLPFTPLHAAARILMGRAREMAGTAAIWGVEDEAGDLVGFAALTRADADGPALLGFALAPHAWGRGIARESLAAVRDWAARTRFASRLTVEVRDEAHAGRLLERLGFRRAGVRARFAEAAGAVADVAVWTVSVDGSALDHAA